MTTAARWPPRRRRARRRPSAPASSRSAAAPTRVVLRITPLTPTYVCVDRGSGKPVLVREHDRRSADVQGQGRAREPRQDGRRRSGRTAGPCRRHGARPGRLRVHGPRPPAAAARRAALRVSARAGIVVTGTEVLTGRVQDRNGPWLSDRLLELGVELAHITICGDRPEDIEAQLRFMADQGVDLILTSGGLGPTADDMTVEVVARFSGRELVLDEELEQRIYAILEPLDEALPALGPGGDEGGQPQAGADPRGRDRDRPGRHGARRDRAREPGRGRAARAAARASADVARGGRERARAGRDRRPNRVRAVDRAHVRPARVGPRRDAARGRARGRRLRAARDHDLPAARRDRDGHALRARRGGGLREPDGARPRAPHARDLLRGRLAHRRPGGASCSRAAGSRPPSPAPPGCWPRGSPTGRVPRRTWRAAWSPMRTRRRPTCSASTRR